MRVNVYAEEITDRVELVEKNGFVGVRFYLYLPATTKLAGGVTLHRGPFMHHDGDDDSAAVTFWGKKDFSDALEKALALLHDHPKSKLAKTTAALEQVRAKLTGLLAGNGDKEDLRAGIDMCVDIAECGIDARHAS
jgi:hypothetical protein